MSSVLKSEVKIATAQEIGVRMDDLLDEATSEINQAAGAQAALLEAAKIVTKLHDHVGTDLDGGLYPLDVGAKIKAYINRAVTALEALSQRAGNMQIAANGRKQAFEKVVNSVKVFKENEVLRLDTLRIREKELVEFPANTGPRTEGRAPGPTIKEQRRTEEATVISDTLIVPEKKKRGRPQKKKS